MKTLHRPPKSIYKRITIISAVYLPPSPSPLFEFTLRIQSYAGGWPVMDHETQIRTAVWRLGTVDC